MAVARFRADRPLNDEQSSEYAFRDREKSRAALVQAFLIRNLNKKELAPMKKESALNPALNPGHKSVAYQLGRLFAVLESVQRSAHGGESPNATIRDRFIGGVLSRPAYVFPTLLKLAAHHMRGGHWGDAVIREIKNRIPAEDGKPAIPPAFALEEQGMFFLGYYHQQEENFLQAARRKKEREEKAKAEAAKKAQQSAESKNTQPAPAEKE